MELLRWRKRGGCDAREILKKEKRTRSMAFGTCVCSY
jgi:hypothetical protein